MYDTYPGGHGDGRVNDFIYRHMGHVIAADRREGEAISDPASPTAQKADELIGRLREIGVEDQRIKTVSAIAHIDFVRQAQSLGNSTPEDFGGQV